MKTFELWIEGIDLWGHEIHKARKVADIEGVDFDTAVDKYVEELPPRQRACWEYDDDVYAWRWMGRRAFDNEKDARAIYG